MVMLLLLGCWPGPLPPCADCADYDDRDGDEVTPAAGDCDDDDENVNPGADEICNGIDDDCDGEVDEEAIDAVQLYVDADDDGFGAGEPSLTCLGGAGFSLRDDDCDDGDPAIRPSAEEICNDGIDNDCDGTAGACLRLGTHPLDAADARFASTIALRRAGTTLAVSERGSIVVGMPGEFLGAGGVLRIVLPTPLTTASLESLVEAQALGTGFLAYTGIQLASAPGGFAVQEEDGVVFRVGTVHVLPWDFPSNPIRLADIATATILGDVLGPVGGVLAMSSEGGLLMSSGEQGVAARWVPEPGTGLLAISEVGVQLVGPTASAVAVGDLNGDGEPDLVVSNDLEDEFLVAADIGRVWVVYGPLAKDLTLDDADRVYAGGLAGTRAGGSLAILPDLDGNGRGELAVGAPAGDSVWLLDATAPSGSLDERSWLRIVGPPSAGFGRAFATPDLDGDGDEELVVSAPGDSEIALESGAVYAFYGPQQPGLHDVDTADLTLTGNGVGHDAGSALTVTDLDDDGHDDLVVGAPGDTAGAVEGGAVYIWRGQGL
ncbi:MAG: FG-GAP repeat protein [Myxococcales bacterium]|nr:FG-GAP repeat protein [Myxococcales bacterium]